MKLTKKIVEPKRNKPIRIAFMTNGPELPTGYAKVLRETVKRLAKDSRFEMVIFNENYSGPDRDFMGIPVVGVHSQNTNQLYKEVLKAVQRVQPDILLILEDSFTLFNFGFHLLPPLPCKKVFYIPLDGGWTPTTGIPILRTMDQIVSMAHFTREEMLRDGFDSEVIWHGVDLMQFFPVSDEHQKQLKKANGFKEDDFIIFNYGRNSLRKSNQALIRSLALYLKDAPDNHKVFLHIMNKEDLHLSVTDYLDRHITQEFGEEIANKFIFSNFDAQKPASDNQVAAMIQMSDLIVSASTGEGFGLIMAEAMACGKPIVHTDYTTPQELLMDTSQGIGLRGWVVPYDALHTSSFNTIHAFVNHEKFAATIKEALSDPVEMKKRGMNGRVFAEKYLNWDYLTEAWKELFLKLV